MITDQPASDPLILDRCKLKAPAEGKRLTSMRNFALLLVVAAAGCGSGGPVTPAQPQPVQAAGTWRGTMRVTSGTGEACVASAFQSAAGVTFNDYNLSVQQSGATLTATSTSIATGITCQLVGTATASSIALNMTTCDAPQPRFFSCSGEVFRDARPSALTVNADIAGNSATATYVESYSVSVWNTTTNLGTATLNAQLTLNRQ